MDVLLFVISAGLIGGGLCVIILSVLGVYRFRFVLNRMHSAAMGDTLGILLVIVGLMVAAGLTWTTLKLLFLVLFMWVASPVSSHLITKLEYLTNKKLPVDYQDETVNEEAESGGR